MPILTINRFDGGLDDRQHGFSADANRLRVLDNAYVTSARTLKKRPGLKKIGKLSEGTVGLCSFRGKLWTFSTDDVVHFDNTKKVQNAKIDSINQSKVLRITATEAFNGAIYLVAQYKNAGFKHHYLTNQKNGTLVLDKACPNAKQIVKASAKIFTIRNDNVYFSATNNAEDWSEEKDAGFLPVSMQTSGASNPVALANWGGRLIVFFNDVLQVWRIDVDPKNHALVDSYQIGTQFSFAHAQARGDVFFLSTAGFRSIGAQSYGVTDMDVGAPIDSLVLEELDKNKKAEPYALYWQKKEMFLCVIGKKIFAYVFSQSSRISAWSIWTIPFEPQAIAELDGVLYLRDNKDNLFAFDDKTYTDDGESFSVLVQTPFLDCGAPAVVKQYTGVDFVSVGDMKVSFSADDSYWSMPMTVSGVTAPLPRLPVEMVGTNLAIKVEVTNDKPFELGEISLAYQRLSGFAI